MKMARLRFEDCEKSPSEACRDWIRTEQHKGIKGLILSLSTEHKMDRCKDEDGWIDGTEGKTGELASQ